MPRRFEIEVRGRRAEQGGKQGCETQIDGCWFGAVRWCTRIFQSTSQERLPTNTCRSGQPAVKYGQEGRLKEEGGSARTTQGSPIMPSFRDDALAAPR